MACDISGMTVDDWFDSILRRRFFHHMRTQFENAMAEGQLTPQQVGEKCERFTRVHDLLAKEWDLLRLDLAIDRLRKPDR